MHAQVSPDVTSSCGSAVTGVSGFAFQGTNSHVLLRSLATTPTMAAEGVKAVKTTSRMLKHPLIMC